MCDRTRPAHRTPRRVLRRTCSFLSAIAVLYPLSLPTGRSFRTLPSRDDFERRLDKQNSRVWFYQDEVRLPDDVYFGCQRGWNDMNINILRGAPSSISLVISLCTHDLEWLRDAIEEIEFDDVTIYSKCGEEAMAWKYLSNRTWSSSASVIALPNVGRVDHTIAYDMLSRPIDTRPDSVVVYLKDTFPVVHQRGLETVSLRDMISNAAGIMGFSCGLRPRPTPLPDSLCSHVSYHGLSRYFQSSAAQLLCPRSRKSCHNNLMSFWHLTKELQLFRLKQHRRSTNLYNRADDADFLSVHSFTTWLRAMEISLPYPVTPVCYGGNFAVKYSNIAKARKPIWQMCDSLSRGDNIIEGHFAERSWAGLLTSRLSTKLTDRILELSFGTLPFPDMIGCIFGCMKTSRPEC